MTQMLRRHGFARACVCCAEPIAPASPARRNFLTGGVAALGLSALGTAGAVTTKPATAQAAKTRIDVHHNFLPKFHADAMAAPGRRAGSLPKWSP